MKKKIPLGLLFLGVTTTSFAGVFTYTSSCGDTYTVEYEEGMSTNEIMQRMQMLDKALCGSGRQTVV